MFEQFKISNNADWFVIGSLDEVTMDALDMGGR